MTALEALPSNGKDDGPVDIFENAFGKLPTTPLDLTLPTLLNAAFSLVIAQLVQQDDVVFGVLTNTRDISLPGVETMLGSCIHLNPFRVSLQPKEDTVLDLCQSLHDQHTQVSRHGYLNLPDIVANCTNWPRQTKIGFIINHLDGGKKTIPLTLNGAPCTAISRSSKINLSDQVMVRCVRSKDTLEVQVVTSTRIITAENARLLDKRLVSTAQVLSKSPDMLLSSLNLEEEP